MIQKMLEYLLPYLLFLCAILESSQKLRSKHWPDLNRKATQSLKYCLFLLPIIFLFLLKIHILLSISGTLFLSYKGYYYFSEKNITCELAERIAASTESPHDMQLSANHATGISLNANEVPELEITPKDERLLTGFMALRKSSQSEQQIPIPPKHKKWFDNWEESLLFRITADCKMHAPQDTLRGCRAAIIAFPASSPGFMTWLKKEGRGKTLIYGGKALLTALQTHYYKVYCSLNINSKLFPEILQKIIILAGGIPQPKNNTRLINPTDIEKLSAKEIQVTFKTWAKSEKFELHECGPSGRRTDSLEGDWLPGCTYKGVGSSNS
jgi:hypothetical protein